ncbi:MAG: phasin family protein [Xanthobacteraceae bacterium]
MTMAKDKEPLQSLTGFVEQTAQTAEQITEQTQGAMENYFNWLQNAMSALPWSNTNLNRILVSHATQNVTATLAFVQNLSQAKNFQDLVKIQSEFMSAQLNSFNDQAKIIGEIYTNAAAATKTPFSVST